MSSLGIRWISMIPPVTRTVVLTCVAISLAASFNLVHYYHLYLNWRRIINSFELWRFVTNFFYFGSLINLVFKICVVHYWRSLEEGVFRSRGADYVYMLLFGSFCLLLVSFNLYIFGIHHPLLLGPILTEMVIYVWSKYNPGVMMDFLGLFPIAAPLLPWAFFCLELGFERRENIIFNLLGFLTGHLYYFLDHVYVITANRRLLKTPRLIRYLFG